MTAPLTATLEAAASEAGLDALGFTAAVPFDDVRRHLEVRKGEGRHGAMSFTYRRPRRSSDITATYPWALSLAVGILAHPVTLEEHPAPTRPRGRVARYARGDLYERLGAGLEAVAAVLAEAGWRAVVVIDQNALVDRAAAHRAGLAWWGKNANLLRPGLGSWFVIGSVVTDADLRAAAPAEPMADGCGTCTRCLAGCPTGAIIEPGVVDARRCLAWLVQARGSFPRRYRAALGDRLYGCDECQDVCPPSRRVAVRTGATPVDGPVPTGPSGDDRERPGAFVDVLDLLAADDETLMTRHGRWYIPDRDPRYLRRNALLVLGNTGAGDDPAVEAALRHYLTTDDALLRSHAAWAASALGRHDLLDLCAGDDDPWVRAELALAGRTAP